MNIGARNGLTRWWLCAVLALNGASACAGEGDDELEPIPREDLAATAAVSLCGGLATCCKSLGLEIDVASCETRLGNNSDFPENAVYDGLAAAECVSTTADLYRQCQVPTNQQTPNCDRIWTGTLDDGSPCVSSTDCRSAFCAYDIAGSSCQQPPALPGPGEGCSLSCVDGYYCDYNTATCLPSKSDGEGCLNDIECSAYYCDAGTCNGGQLFVQLCQSFAAGGGNTFCCAVDALCSACGCSSSQSDIASAGNAEVCQFVLEDGGLGCANMSEDDALALCL
jgi:hypothetical protein